MKITYIFHSGFLLEMEEANFLFDYVKGEIPKMDREKPLYVFASHSHSDHFDPCIFELEEEYPNITYILSSDIEAEHKKNRYFMSAYENKIIGKNKIQTLKSTDLGVAFFLETEKKKIYHAGDLHWWHWIGEPEEENVWMEKAYKKELDFLRGKQLDLAFLVLDPRQEEVFDWGIQFFLETVDVKTVVPMHCWEEYSIIPKYKKSQKGIAFADKILEIEKEGQQFVIDRK